MREAEYQAAVVSLLESIASNTRRVAEACERAELALPSPMADLKDAFGPQDPVTGDPTPAQRVVASRRQRRGKGGQ